MNWRLPLFLLVLAACACARAPLRSNETVCPEYRDLRCATAPECSLDRARGCQVCQCRPSAPATREGQLPSGVPPDQR